MRILTLVMLTATMGAAPLTEAQRRQLEPVADGSALLDEQGFFALLENAATWRGEAGDEAGAMVADYASLRAAPGEYRGRLCLIEGALRRGATPARFSRAGPWENTWRQWVVQWGKGAGDVAVVYLVEPSAVPVGATVRLPARFYKIWRDTDQQGTASDYLVFVGKHASVTRVNSVEGAPGAWTQTTVLTVALVIAALAYLILRRHVAATRRRDPRLPTARQNRNAHAHRNTPPAPVNTPPLSDDPAEALEQLQRQGQIHED